MPWTWHVWPDAGWLTLLIWPVPWLRSCGYWLIWDSLGQDEWSAFILQEASWGTCVWQWQRCKSLHYACWHPITMQSPELRGQAECSALPQGEGPANLCGQGGGYQEELPCNWLTPQHATEMSGFQKHQVLTISLNLNQESPITMFRERLRGKTGSWCGEVSATHLVCRLCFLWLGECLSAERKECNKNAKGYRGPKWAGRELPPYRVQLRNPMGTPSGPLKDLTPDHWQRFWGNKENGRCSQIR